MYLATYVTPFLSTNLNPIYKHLRQDGVTYGTLISMANVAARALTRGDRSPSPAPSRATVASSAGSDCGAAITTAASMDRRRLAMVLEQSITLILEQASLSLTDPRFVLHLLRCSIKLT